MPPLLVAEAIGKQYRGRRVLTSAYLQATPGVITGLVGCNGAGKTTLLKIAAGMVGADYGNVRFGGVLYMRPRLHQLARQGLFFLPADQSYLSPAVTVAAHLIAVERQLGTSHNPDVVEMLRLDSLLSRQARQLSGGERRRLQLAMACLRAPRCLLADEPFRDLAPTDVELTMTILRQLAAQGCAVVVTGHEVSFMFATVQDVIWVTSGTSRYMGSRAQAETDWAFRREFLGAYPLKPTPTSNQLQL